MKKPMGFDEFLKEAAPLFGLQRRPFQRRGVKRKVERRIAEVGFSHFEEYLLKVQKDPEEQDHLSKILTVTISRFFRDKKVFDLLENSIFPTILKNKKEKDEFKIWSIGCASGEEPYSFLLLWKEKFEKNFPQIHLSILATDINEKLLERAKEGRYKKSSLKEVPKEVLKSTLILKMDFISLIDLFKRAWDSKSMTSFMKNRFPEWILSYVETWRLPTFPRNAR